MVNVKMGFVIVIHHLLEKVVPTVKKIYSEILECKFGKFNITSFICDCDQGYFGVNCEYKTCPNSCNNNGECDKETGQCLCKQGFTGLDCSISNFFLIQKHVQIIAITEANVSKAYASVKEIGTVHNALLENAPMTAMEMVNAIQRL
jgi:hypothetical protein